MSDHKPSFNVQRPENLQSLSWTHRLAYISRVLPASLHREILALGVQPGQRILDYGCADLQYRNSFPEAAEYIAADLTGNPKADVYLLDNGTLPLADAAVDIVISTQVLEHVTDPEVYLSECYRVLRPGGKLLLSTHGMMVYHPDPVDYWRWTLSGLEKIISNQGLVIDRKSGVMGLACVGLQFFQDALLSRVPGKVRPIFIYAVQHLIAMLDKRTSDESRKLNALVYIISARK